MIVNFSIQNFGSIKNKQSVSFEADETTHLEEAYVVNTGDALAEAGTIYGPNASKDNGTKALTLRELVLQPAERRRRAGVRAVSFDSDTPGQYSPYRSNFCNKVSSTLRGRVLEEWLSRGAVVFNSTKENLYRRTTTMESVHEDHVWRTDNDREGVREGTEANTLWINTVLRIPEDEYRLQGTQAGDRLV